MLGSALALLCPYSRFLILFGCHVRTVSFWAQPPLRTCFMSLGSLMDHAQGRAFHHHLARAIMHLNHLAGFLPFFEPSIEYEDSLPPAHFRLERPTSRGLHTFVPFPPSGPPPTMVSHGGIPSHMVINPEPNLRPVSARPPPDSEPMPTTGSPRLPILMSDPGPDPSPGTTTVVEHPRLTTRTTIPVPARSKQRASSMIDPQPKKKQKGESIPESRITTNPNLGHSGTLPIPSDVPSGGPNSDDSDGDAASGAASTHPAADASASLRRPLEDTINYHHDAATNPVSTAPPRTSTLTLTPNPKAPPSPTMRILHRIAADPSRDPPFRPWTNADDQELISMKQDTKSRPSWKTIGARLHREPHVCKLRWGILKQTPGVMDQHGRMNPPHEPEAED